MAEAVSRLNAIIQCLKNIFFITLGIRPRQNAHWIRRKSALL